MAPVQSGGRHHRLAGTGAWFSRDAGAEMAVAEPAHSDRIIACGATGQVVPTGARLSARQRRSARYCAGPVHCRPGAHCHLPAARTAVHAPGGNV